MPSDIREILSPFILMGLEGTSLTGIEREILSTTPPAGVILFHRNVESRDQLFRLASEVTSVIATSSGSPPIIAADHEGGRISVLARALGAPPSPRAAWKPRSRELLASMIEETSILLRSCGINLVLAPVADVNSEPLNPVIGTRAYAEEPEDVSDAIRTAVSVFSAAGLLSCLKHFPGHGSTILDSHLALPALGRELEKGVTGHLGPFAVGIAEGADTVMTAHVAAAQGDPPASLDERITGGLLRRVLGFDGVVITDALEMAGALPDGIPMRSIDPHLGEDKGIDACPAAVAAAALSAGNDILLMSRPASDVFAELERCSSDLAGMFLGDRLVGMMAESAGRIERLRERVLTPGAPAAAGAGAPEGTGNIAGESGEKIAAEAVKVLSGIDMGGSRLAVDPLVPSFLGEMSDFENHVVRRFIQRILVELEKRLKLPGKDIDDLSSPHDLESMERDGEPTGLHIFRPWKEYFPSNMIILLMRRPSRKEVLLAAAEGCGIVVAAGRPWDADILEKDRIVIVTEGIYDAAAGAVIRLMGL